MQEFHLASWFVAVIVATDQPVIKHLKHFNYPLRQAAGTPGGWSLIS